MGRSLPFIDSRQAFLRGARDGVSIALGYLAVSFSLGIAARNVGLTAFQGFALSALGMASAGEYAALTVIASAGSFLEMALVTLVTNARYLLMSMALSQRLRPETPLLHRLALGGCVTDELFGISVAGPAPLNPWYTFGAYALAMPAWASGTALGVAAGNLLPAQITAALTMALFGMFLAIIIPPARREPAVGLFVALSFAASFAAGQMPGLSALSSGTRTIILTVALSAAAAAFFPVRQEEAVSHTEKEATHAA